MMMVMSVKEMQPSKETKAEREKQFVKLFKVYIFYIFWGLVRVRPLRFKYLYIVKQKKRERVRLMTNQTRSKRMHKSIRKSV